MESKNKIMMAVIAIAIVAAIAITVFLVNKNTDTVYVVSFDTNGGNEVSSQKVESGEKVNKPANPTRDGYEFLGWYFGDEEYDFSNPVEENIKLEAKWEKITQNDEEVKDDDKVEDKEEEEEEKVTKYTVTFNSEGGTKVSKQTIEEGKKATEPKSPTKNGYTFKGWYIGSTKYNFSNKVTKNITLTAKWEQVAEKPSTEPEEEKPNTQPEQPKEYTVKFDVDGKIVSTKTVKEGEKVSKPSAPTKDGYTFKYWTLNGTEYDFTKAVTGDITLKADWKKNDVITWKSEKVDGSLYPQVRIFIVKNNECVSGTADIENVSGETIPGKRIPATGWVTFADTVRELKNIKVD